MVAYGSLGGAERLWWLLRHFGHDACAVIDLDAWRGPLRGGEEEVEPQAFVPVEQDDDAIGLDALEARREELVVVDARVPTRWRGEPNPLDRVPGRIPGALNAPWNAELPPLPAGELVAYCGSGVTACVVLHRLHLAGRDGLPLPRLVVGARAVSGTAGGAFCVGESLCAGHPPDRRHRSVPRLRQLGVVVARRPGGRTRRLGAGAEGTRAGNARPPAHEPAPVD